jgi:hypothetical protein
MVAAFCLELGAISQYQPQPPIWKTIGILPLIFLEGLSFIAINVIFHGPIAIPAYVLTGLVIAGLVRLALRFSKREL